MKKLTKIFCCNIFLLLLVMLLVGCTGGTKEELKPDPSKSYPALEPKEETDDTEETRNENSNNTFKSEEDNLLSKYSSEEIEYARVWLQLGSNQEIDELNVRYIPAGTPLNPDDNTDVSYPESVIQIRGTRIVDGIVTYSGNGDGTINVYNVPLRWYGGFPPPDDIDEEAIREQMEDIIENTKLVYVDPGDDREIIKLINKMNIQ